MASNSGVAAKALTVLVSLVLTNTFATTAAETKHKDLQDSVDYAQGLLANGLRGEAAPRLAAASSGRELLQRRRQSRSQGRNSCNLSSEDVERIYDISSRQWLVSDDTLEALNRDLQALIECANENDILLLPTSQTIKPARTLFLSQNLTITSQSERRSDRNRNQTSSIERVSLTCPDSGQLLLSRSSDFTLQNLIIEDCNTTSSVIELDLECDDDEAIGSARFIGITMARNTMRGQASIIDASSARCVHLELNDVVIRRSRCAESCIFLSASNSLDNITVVGNQRSSESNLDSSIFSASDRAQTIVVNMTSEQNEIRSIHILNGTLNITVSHFEDNNAEGGVAILLDASPSGYIDHCTFIKNRGLSEFGGAIEANTSNVSISSSTFQENTSPSGGALAFQDRCNSSIVNSRFANNTAGSDGGAIFATSSLVMLSNSSFSGNHARVGGVLTAIFSSNISISQVEFVANNASAVGCLNLSSPGNGTITNSVFTSNSAESGAGAVNSEQNFRLSISNSTFAGNKANAQGGALRGTSNSILIVDDVVFIENEAERGGGLYMSNFCNATVSNCTFTNNAAPTSGGGVRLQNSSAVFLTSSIFSGNSARFGGGFFAWRNSTVLLLKNSFVRNNASANGGAVYFDRTNAVLSSIRSAYNYAPSAGSFFVVRSSLSISNSTFAGNRARSQGGALRGRSSCTLTIDDVAFDENEAYRGGGLYISDFCNATVSNCTFSNNVGSRGGGAVRLESNATISLTTSIFSENIATFGGAFFAWRNSTVALLNNSFTSNNAATSGGAIHIQDSNALLSYIRLAFNNATNGGSLYVSRSSLDVTSSRFHRSRASQDGGAIYIRATNATLETIHLESNEAGDVGGGICATLASRLNASNVDAVSNNARSMGGGIALGNVSSLLCYSCTFFDNEALSGAGLYVNSNNSIAIVAQLQNSQFENNTARSYGGAIEFAALVNRSINCSSPNVTCGHLVLLNVSFKGNYAEQSGAIVLTTDPNRVLVDCEYREGTKRNQTFLNETAMNSFEVLNPRKLCPSWTRNRVSSTEYGGLVGTYGQGVVLAIDPGAKIRLAGNRTSGYVLENVSSGRRFPTINVTVVDGYGLGPALTRPRAFEARISSPDDFISGLYLTNIVEGFGSFSRVIGFVDPGNYTLEFSFNNSTLETFNVTVIVRECIVGEEPTFDRLTCQPCDEFSYNFNTSELGGCKECPDDATCDGRYIVPKNGHWHYGPCHDRVKKCLVSDACKYAKRNESLRNSTQNLTDCRLNDTALEAYHDALCNKGYEGPLCGSCQSSYGLSFLFQCLKCPHKSISFLIVSGVTLYLFAVASFTIRGCLPFNIRRAQWASRRIISSESRGAQPAAPVQDPEINVEMVQMMVEGRVPREYFQRRQEASTSQTPIPPTRQIVINFLQTTAVAASVDLDWTDGMNRFFETSEYVGAVATSAISRSVVCIGSSASKLTRLVWRMLFSLIVPCLVILLFATFWGLVAIRSGEDLSYFAKRAILSVIAVAYISYLGLTRTAVRAFYCVDVYDSVDLFVGSKTKYWAIDTSIECYGGDHSSIIAIAVIILVVVTVLFPLISAAVLSQKKEGQVRRDGWKFETAGFLFRAFKESCHFWESFVMIRKACLSVIVVFSYPLGGLSQGILALVVLLTCLYAHLTIKPYRKDLKILNHFESASLLVSCLTFTLGLLFENGRCSEPVRFFLSVVIIVVNTSFFLFLLFAFSMSAIAHWRMVLQYENIPFPDQAPCWRVAMIYTDSRFRICLNASREV